MEKPMWFRIGRACLYSTFVIYYRSFGSLYLCIRHPSLWIPFKGFYPSNSSPPHLKINDCTCKKVLLCAHVMTKSLSFQMIQCCYFLHTVLSKANTFISDSFHTSFISWGWHSFSSLLRDHIWQKASLLLGHWIALPCTNVYVSTLYTVDENKHITTKRSVCGDLLPKSHSNTIYRILLMWTFIFNPLKIQYNTHYFII